MSVFLLQIIAMVTMVFDHTAYMFFGNPLWMRCVGRIAFPVYAFLLAEGFRHIRQDEKRVSDHLRFYVLLALISEIGYDLTEMKPLSVEGLFSSQSNMFTLLISFLGLLAIEKWKGKPLYQLAAVLLSAFATSLMISNFKFAGVLMVYADYFYLENAEGKSFFRKAGELLLILICYLPIYHWARYGFCDWATYLEKLDFKNICWYWTHLATVPLLAAYNGKLGPRSRGFRLFYRWFYPAHLLVFGAVYQLCPYFT